MSSVAPAPRASKHFLPTATRSRLTPSRLPAGRRRASSTRARAVTHLTPSRLPAGRRPRACTESGSPARLAAAVVRLLDVVAQQLGRMGSSTAPSLLIRDAEPSGSMCDGNARGWRVLGRACGRGVGLVAGWCLEDRSISTINLVLKRKKKGTAAHSCRITSAEHRLWSRFVVEVPQGCMVLLCYASYMLLLSAQHSGSCRS